MEFKQKKYISYDAALDRMQKYCAYQDRCHKEVRSKLFEIGMYGDDLENIIVKLIEEKFLDEQRFATAYAGGKFRLKKWGRIRIQRELKMRQISAYCLKKAMDEITDEDYMETLDALLEKKNRVLRENNIWKRRKKLADYVISKGYESYLVWEAVKRLLK
ncbi:MAG: regulatory protein [Paraglaciecola sp.]